MEQKTPDAWKSGRTGHSSFMQVQCLCNSSGCLVPFVLFSHYFLSDLGKSFKDDVCLYSLRDGVGRVENGHTL